MTEPMPYGEMVQELTHLRAQYEQFIIERERERIIKLLKDYWCGEAPCDKHPVRMDWIIAAIQLKQGETDGEVNDDLVSKSEM